MYCCCLFVARFYMHRAHVGVTTGLGLLLHAYSSLDGFFLFCFQMLLSKSKPWSMLTAHFDSSFFFMQMSAYFAPAFFSHLLGKCLRRNNPLLEVSKLGLVVLGTFAVVWWPYLYSKDAILRVQEMLTTNVYLETQLAF